MRLFFPPVARATVINSTSRELDYYNPQVYNIKIKKVYKGENEIKNAQGTEYSGPTNITTQLFTLPTGSSCAVFLNSGAEYLLTGSIDEEKQLSTDFCAWNEEWHRLTHSQRAGVRRDYAANCQCAPDPFCYGPDCEKKSTGCNMLTSDSCSRRYTFCKAGSDSSCKWVKTPQYTKCWSYDH